MVATCQEDGLWHPDPSEVVCHSKSSLTYLRLANMHDYNDKMLLRYLFSRGMPCSYEFKQLGAHNKRFW